jgi:hypothetical protein
MSTLDGPPQNPVFAITPDSLSLWASAPGVVELRLSPMGDLLAAVVQVEDRLRVEILER